MNSNSFIQTHQINLNNFNIVQEISIGYFGSVYKVEEKSTGNIYVAKVIDCNNSEDKCNKIIDQEVKTMNCAKHPTIVKFIGYSKKDFQEKNNVTLITELAKNGSLNDVIKSIMESRKPENYTNTSKQIILAGVARSMKCLHNRDIIHLNLKSSNILLDENFHPLITDFGMLNSKIFDIFHSCQLSQIIDTISYQSPEILKRMKYDEKVDVYSFGILMYEILNDSFSYKELLNEKMTENKFKSKIVLEKYRPKFEKPINEFLKKLIEQCWENEPSKRPTFDEIFDKLGTIDENNSNKYFLDDVDVNEFKLYVDNIVNQTDFLYEEISKLKKENQKLEKENQQLKEENQQLKSFNRHNQSNQDKNLTLIKIAFLSQENLSSRFKEEYNDLLNYYKNRINATIEKSVIGNIVRKSTILRPKPKFIPFFLKQQEINLLQNTFDINRIELEAMKYEVFQNFKDDEVSKTNWTFIFSHEEIFKQLEESLRNDIKNNEHEMIIVGQTIIANDYFAEYEKLRRNIPLEHQKQIFTYHGTKLNNHHSIVLKHFYDHGQDRMKMSDCGYFGKGFFTTDNIFYASEYSNKYQSLKFNEKGYVIACLSIYNDLYVKPITDSSYFGKDIDKTYADNYGIHYAFCGSSTVFHPIPKSDKDKNFITESEFVFPNKYQIIPFCSFTVMRTDHYILWKEENIDKRPCSSFMYELLKKTLFNIYSAKSNDEAIEIINNKKRNKIKLIISDNDLEDESTAQTLIEQSRKIMTTNFVCLVFSLTKNDIIWIPETENVLFTSSFDDIETFTSLEMNEKNIIEFSNKLQKKCTYEFKINRDELLSFPTTLESFYKPKI